MNQDPLTYRYARNLNEAFGPHTSQEVEPMPDTTDKKDAPVLYMCAVAVAWIAYVVLVWG